MKSTLKITLLFILGSSSVFAQVKEEVYPPPPPISELPPQPKPEIYEFPDVEAQFPGGPDSLSAFVRNTLIYPEVSKDMGDQGKVYVSFVIEVDGSISNVVVERGVSAELDREAKRIIRNMPKWITAEVKGKPVRSRYRLPIWFKLD